MAAKPTTLRVEFYGIPRVRAGVSETELEIPAGVVTLADVLRMLAARFPDLAETCFVGDALHESCAANLGGRRFLRDRSARFAAGQTLLLMSADAGG